MHPSGEEAYLPPAVALGLDLPRRWPAFELVRPEMGKQTVRTATPVGVEPELGHPPTRAPSDQPARGLAAPDLVFVRRGDRPPPLGVGEDEANRLGSRWLACTLDEQRLIRMRRTLDGVNRGGYLGEEVELKLAHRRRLSAG
jgi:hypothetical protein